MVNVKAAAENELKETDVGMIPADWDIAALGEFCMCKGGYAFPHRYQGSAVGEYPFYKVSDMNLPGNEYLMGVANNYIEVTEAEAIKARPFRAGTVIFPKIGAAVGTNKKRLLGCDAIVDNNVMGVWVEDRDRCIDDFLFYLFSTIDLNELANVGTVPSIANSRVEKHVVSLPPLPEQRRIAAVLNAIQDAIAAQEDVIAEARALKRSLMQRLFTYGPGREPAETKETEIGEIPAYWELVPVGNLCRSIVPGREKPKRFDGEIPWVTIADIRDRPFVDKSTSGLALTKDAIDEVHGRVIPRNSVIMSCVGEFGLTTVAAREIVINQQLHAFVCPKGLDPYFLAQALQMQKPYMENIAHFTTIAYLNKNKCESVPISVPPLEQQLEIAGILTDADTKIAAEEDRKSALHDLFKSALHQLMTGQIRLLSDKGPVHRKWENQNA